MSSSLLLQQCPACLVRRTCIVFVMGGKCPYSWSLVGCCRQDLFNTALNILVPIFTTCNDILEKQALSLPWKKTCHNVFIIFLIFLTKSIRRQIPSLLTFPIFFQVVTHCRLRSIEFKCYFLCTFTWVAFHQFSWSRSDGCPDLGSSFNHVSPEWNLESQFGTWWSVITLWL